MSFKLPELGYAYDALEPAIDAKTMEIHHTKHHKTYVDNLNEAIKGTEHEKKSIEELCKTASDIAALRNNGGGHYNHMFFWETLTPGGKKEPGGNLKKAIEEYGGYEKLKKDFTEAAKKRFGSGWAWLCKDKNGKLTICSSANQDNPLMPGVGCGNHPILGLDIWEHAYYLNYQNRRPDYITAFFELINWDKVEERYNK